MTNNELTKIARAAGFHIEGEKIKLHCTSKFNLTEMMAKFAELLQANSAPAEKLLEALENIALSKIYEPYVVDYAHKAVEDYKKKI